MSGLSQPATRTCGEASLTRVRTDFQRRSASSRPPCDGQQLLVARCLRCLDEDHPGELRAVGAEIDVLQVVEEHRPGELVSAEHIGPHPTRPRHRARLLTAPACRARRTCGRRGGRAPTADDAPEDVKNALALRNVCAIEGLCPASHTEPNFQSTRSRAPQWAPQPGCPWRLRPRAALPADR